MSIDTNLNVSPFFDDFDEDKNFHRILFRPAVPIQARELNQLQTILQNQIERMGTHLFKDGTILTGCNFNFDDSYDYIKLADLQVDGQPVDVDSYANSYLVSSANLRSLVINQTSGFESQNPNLSTLYIKYLNSGDGDEKLYANADVLTVYGRHANGDIDTNTTIGQIRVANASFTAPVGRGYAMSVLDGYIYQKGHLIRVDSQTVVVAAYSQSPNNVSVGFNTVESLVDENEDTSLLDNASGFSNKNAPGALRLKLNPTLEVANTDALPNTFFALAQFENGQAVKQRETTEYNNIGREMSKRTFEESGDYVVRPFKVTSAPITGNTTHLYIASGAGLAYIDGFRVEQFDNRYTPTAKGTDFRVKENQTVTANFGNYAKVNELIGHFGTNVAETVNLRDAAATSLTSSTYTIGTPGNVIGTAKVRSILHESGNPGTPGAVYKLYLFDVIMNAGKNFSDVLSIQSTTGIADVIQEGGVSYVYETDFNKLIFPFGQKAIKTLLDEGGNTDTSFIYRTRKTDGQFGTNGQLSITLPSGFIFPYTAGATLNDTQEEDLIVVPSVNAVSANLTGTVDISSGSNVVTGSGTSFVSVLSVGNYITVLGDAGPKRVTAIVNNTSLTVESNFGATNASSQFARSYPQNVPIKLSGVGGGSANVDGTGQVLTLALGQTLTATANAVITYNATKTEAIQLNKTITKNAYVKVDANTNAGGVAGPWSLGLPDVVELVAVYKHTSYTGIEDSTKDVTAHFMLDVGQTENAYGLAKLRKKPTSSLSITTADKLLALVNVFQSDATGGGRGYYSIDSYPIDDATVPTPNNKIRTEEVPIFTSTSGVSYDLRNCVDFRPYCSNTANVATSAATATENPSITEAYAATEKYFPVPNETMTTDLQYYLGRMDTLVLDSFGTLRIVEGAPSENPVPPTKTNNAMLLAHITVPPYPSLSIPEATAAGRPDYAVRFRLSQNRRYTMSDIAQLDKRLGNLEYYTSLTLLEKETNDLIIPSSIDGTLDRFKNGILVDPFNDFAISNLLSAEYKAAIDPSASEMMPQFRQNKFDLEVASVTNVTQTGELVTLPYSHVTLFSQPYASRFRNLTEQYYSYRGKAEIFPAYDNYHEVRTSPQTITLDMAQATLDLIDNLNELLPLTQTSQTVQVTNQQNVIANTAFNQTIEQIRTTMITTTTEGLTGTVNEAPVGDFVTDIRFLPYMREQRLKIYLYGLRPLTRIYPFFDGEEVTDYCMPAVLDGSSTVDPDFFQKDGEKGDAIYTDSIGQAFILFDVPADTFLAGEREFIVCDVDQLDSISSSTTQAHAKFNAFNFSVEKTTLATRTADVDISSTTSTSTTTDRTLINRPVPQPDPPDFDDIQEPGVGRWRGIDPLAQTFTVDPSLCDGLEGVFLTKIDTYFKRKSNSVGVTLEIRTVQNGYPTKQVVPFSRVRLASSDINVSDTAASATTFTFPSPVFLKSGFEYCFVLVPDGDNPDFLAWVAEIGGTDVLSSEAQITQDWGSGMLFMSHNNSTWTALQNEDLKFKIYRANFTQQAGTLTLRNKPYEYFSVNGLSGAFVPGERVVALGTNATGNVVVSSSNTTIAGDGTTFLSNLAVNGYITLRSGDDYDVLKIKAITNNTSLTVYSTPKFTNATAKYQHSVTGDVFFYDSLEGELILENSTAANATFLFEAADVLYAPESNSGATVVSVDDKIISYFQPLIGKTSVQGTQLVLTGTTTANNDAQTEDQRFQFGVTNYLDSNEVIIKSRSNEITDLSGNRSFIAEIAYSTEFNMVSPVVDIKPCSILFYKNKINNDLTNEYLASGNALAKYVSKTVNLAENQESEDMKVFLTAYRPVGTDITVYAKLKNESDNEGFDLKNWTKLELETSLYSGASNRKDFVELEYTFPDEPEVTALTGVVAVTNAEANVIGVGTDFANDLAVGDVVSITTAASQFVASVESITNATHIILESPVPFSNTSTSISILDEPNTGFRNDQLEGVISYINEAGARFDGYKTFAVKVVLTANSTHKVPRVKDLRALAVTI